MYEQEVGSMLRYARDGQRLFRLPTMALLCRYLDSRDPASVLRRLVDESFGTSQHERRLREIVTRCDLDGTMSQEGAAADLNVSRRHFHRLRAKAIGAIARRVAQIVGHGAPSFGQAGAIETLAEILVSFDPETAEHINARLGERSPSRHLRAMRARLKLCKPLYDSTGLADTAADSVAARALLAQSYALEGAVETANALHTQLLATRESSAQFDFVSRIELEQLLFLLAKQQCCAPQMVTSSTSLRDIHAQRLDPSLRALVLSLEAEIHAGNNEDAHRTYEMLETLSIRSRDLYALAFGLKLRAELAFIECDYDLALDLAQTAFAAMTKLPADANECLTLIMRIHLLRSSPYEPPLTMPERPERAWDAIASDIFRARLLIRDGSRDAAASIAHSALGRISPNTYVGLEAQAQATIAACDSNAAAAQVRCIQAFSLYAPTRDALLAHDLFAVANIPCSTLGPFAIDQSLVRAFAAQIGEAFPEFAYQHSEHTGPVTRWLEYLLRANAGETVAWARFEQCVEEMSITGSGLATLRDARFRSLRERVIELLRPLIAPPERPASARKTREIVDNLALLTSGREHRDV
jgi:hypothetical protein